MSGLKCLLHMPPWPTVCCIWSWHLEPLLRPFASTLAQSTLSIPTQPQPRAHGALKQVTAVLRLTAPTTIF